MRLKSLVLLTLVFTMLLSMSVVAFAEYDRTGWPEKVRIGVLPEEDHAVMVERYQSLMVHFEDALGLPVELFFGTDFTAMIEAMRFKHIEVSKFGPFAYILAHDRANARAFVQGARDASNPTYTSHIIVRKDSGINAISDLEGKTFAWVDPASASGYMFPRAHLVAELDTTNDHIDDLFRAVVFSGGHDASVRLVINGDVDAAAVSDSQVQRMAAAEFPGVDNLQVLTETRPIPRSPEAYRDDLPESLKQALYDAYTSFDDEEFLVAHNYHDGFIPVEDDAYDVVRDTARLLGLSPEDLL